MAQTTKNKSTSSKERALASMKRAALALQERRRRPRKGVLMKPSPKHARKDAIKPLPFYAQIEVVMGKDVPADYVGLKGVILGRAKLADGGWNYGVFFAGGSYYLPHASLKPTGVVFKRSDIYPGESIKVSVDESGVGTVVNT